MNQQAVTDRFTSFALELFQPNSDLLVEVERLSAEVRFLRAQ